MAASSKAPCALESKILSMNENKRLLSLDAYRGAVMLFMASAGFGIPKVAASQPDSIWATLAPLLEHAPWIGCAPWDLIQPAFMFMVGVAMPYSYGKRRELGESTGRQFGHVLVRSIILILLAVMLASRKETTWIFTNVLGQIGLGYTFLYLIWRGGAAAQVMASLVILLGTWLAFVLYPVPPAGTDVLPGLAAHWSKNLNLATAFDHWFLNLFPRSEPWVPNEGGYHTLNFVPSLVTMILGTMAGDHLRSDKPLQTKIRNFFLGGVMLVIAGWVAGQFACPIVKRIWTPSWALFSGGWVLLGLGVSVWLFDVRGFKRLAWPLAIVGMNSIAIYLGSQLCTGWIREFLHIHFGGSAFYSAGLGPIYERCGILLVFWLLCWWLHRNKAYLRI